MQNEFCTPASSSPKICPNSSYSPPLNNSGIWQTTYDDAGIYTTTVTVSDGYTNISQDVRITVLNVNRPPILSPIGTLTALEGTYFVYHIIATDPDNDQLMYYDNTSMFNINPFIGEIGFTPKNIFVGNHSVNISVTDGDLIDSQAVTFVIKNINNPPAMEFVFPQTASEGTNFTLQVNATDPDGDQLIYSDDTDIFEINSTTGLIRFTANSSDIGTHFINITVTDGIESDTVVLNLVVIPGKSIKLEPIQDIIAYAGDLVKIVVNFTRL
ncbi:MAG: Ig-like domain-containing protein [Anaerolineaceae bacterium]|nr:Ig-like domain-containing protein [Anaerolineaceae bacterium]